MKTSTDLTPNANTFFKSPSYETRRRAYLDKTADVTNAATPPQQSNDVYNYQDDGMTLSQ